MVADFIESKMKKILETTEDPLEYEVQEILIEKYLAGEVAVEFIDGQPCYSLVEKDDAQLELPLEL